MSRCKAVGQGYRDRAHRDMHRPSCEAARKPLLSECHGFDRRIIGKHGDREICSFRRLGWTCRDLRALCNECFCTFWTPVPHGQCVSVLEEVAGHAAAHRTQSQERNVHCLSPLLDLLEKTIGRLRRCMDGVIVTASEQIVGFEHGNAEAGKALMGSFNRSCNADRAAGVLDNGSGKTLTLGIFGGVAHAIIEGEACEENPGEPAFTQIASKPGWGHPVILEKGRVGIHVRTEALAQDEPRMRDLKIRMQARAMRFLNTMVWPKSLRPVIHLDCFKGLSSRV